MNFTSGSAAAANHLASEMPPRLLKWAMIDAHWRLILDIFGKVEQEAALRRPSTTVSVNAPLPLFAFDNRIRGYIKVNDTFYISKDDKRYVVVYAGPMKTKAGNEVAGMVATALSGDDKGSLLVTNMEAGQQYPITVMRFPVPVFYGKQAAARYAQYVEMMTKKGNAALILPMETAPAKPDEPEAPPPPSDVDDPSKADVVIRHSAAEGTTADWDHAADRNRPDDKSIYKVIRGAGFVPAHRAGGIYRRTNSVGLMETRAPIANMVEALHQRGYTVFLDLGKSEAEEALVRKREYLAERAAYTAERAEKLAGKAEALGAHADVRREREVTHQDIAGFFPTPPDLAAAVAEQATEDLDSGAQVLEPSAGHGALVRALQKHGVTPDVIEVDGRLRPELAKLGAPLVATDVMDPSFRPGTLYDRVVMNPPFEGGQALEHVQRAWQWLTPGGKLYAIMPESVIYRQDRKHADFRAWLDRYGASIEDIERQKFGRSGDVKTRLVIVEKPASQPYEDGDDETLRQIAVARENARPASAKPEKSARERYNEIAQRVRAAERSWGGVSKADRAELKAAETAVYAEQTAAKAQRLQSRAAHVGLAQVHKGGVEAVRPPPVPAPRRAPVKQEAVSFVDRFGEAIRSGFKKAIGADSVTREGERSRTRGYYAVTWSTGVGRLRKSFLVAEGASEFSEGGPPYRVRVAKPPPEGVSMYSPEYLEWRSNEPDVPAAVAWLIETLNNDREVRKVLGR